MQTSIKQIIKLGVLVATLLFNIAVQAQGSIIPVYKTNPPKPQLGFDVSANQSVAIRFSPVEDVTLNAIEVWFMNNSSMKQADVTITLRNDTKYKNKLSVPGDKVLESWTFTVSSLGWNTEKQVLVSKFNSELKHNQRYWLVAESAALPLENPVWSIADSDGENIPLGFEGSYNPELKKWNSLGYSAIPTVAILGELPANSENE